MTETAVLTEFGVQGAARRVVVIRNPTAGRRRERFYRAVLAALDREGCSVVGYDTEHAGHAEAIAASIPPGSADVLAVAGGDGTINEVLNGLGGEAPPLAVIPLGTANLLALELGLPKASEEIARTISHGLPFPIRLGRVNGRRFVMMAGAGFDAHVVAGVSARLKRLAGKGAYVWRSLVELWRYRLDGYEVEVDGRMHPAASVVVANGRHYGGPYVIAPEAGLAEGSLEVCLFERGGRWNVVRYGLGLLAGRLPRTSGFRIVRGRLIRITGPAAERIQVDGDAAGTLPATIGLDPRAFLVLASPEAASRAAFMK